MGTPRLASCRLPQGPTLCANTSPGEKKSHCNHAPRRSSCRPPPGAKRSAPGRSSRRPPAPRSSGCSDKHRATPAGRVMQRQPKGARNPRTILPRSPTPQHLPNTPTRASTHTQKHTEKINAVDTWETKRAAAVVHVVGWEGLPQRAVGTGLHSVPCTPRQAAGVRARAHRAPT